MELQHVNVKLYVDGDLAVELVRFIEVFHQWIRDSILDELLIDVADYRHVPDGPGVLLVGHEADYSMDQTDGRVGLRYNRKAPVEGSNEDRFRQAFASAARACRLLEERFADDGPLRFSRQEFELFINDRALAPNTDETFVAYKPQIESFLTATLGHSDFSLERRAAKRSRFGVHVTVAKAFDLDAIAATLKSSASSG